MRPCTFGSMKQLLYSCVPRLYLVCIVPPYILQTEIKIGQDYATIVCKCLLHVCCVQFNLPSSIWVLIGSSVFLSDFRVRNRPCACSFLVNNISRRALAYAISSLAGIFSKLWPLNCVGTKNFTFHLH